MPRYIATYVESNDTCDGKARILGVFKTKDEAIKMVHGDIENWANTHLEDDVTIDFGKMSAIYNDNSNFGCEWNIEEVNII